MRARKIDTNQPELVKLIRQLGMSVQITSMLGEGFVDIIVGHQKFNYLMEIKDPSQPPSKRRLTPDEQHFFDTWKGQVDKVETIDDVLRIVNKK